MLRLLSLDMSRRLTNWLFSIGMLSFIAVYVHMLNLFSNMGIDTNEFNTVWLSFDVEIFQTFIRNIAEQGHLPVFLSTFSWNILSISAFMVAFYSLTLIILRNLDPASRLIRFAKYFHIFPIAIAAIDILSSLLILWTGLDLLSLSTGTAQIISGSYISRVLLLYILFLWLVVSGINITWRRFRPASI